MMNLKLGLELYYFYLNFLVKMLSEIDNFDISKELEPLLKSPGVILFTLSSVHCALNKTEISN